MQEKSELRTYGWRSWRNVAIELLVAVGLGIALTLVESGGTKEFPPAVTFLRNSILLVCAFLASRGLETMLSWAIEQSRFPTIFRSILYAAGGWLGFFVGLILVGALLERGETDFDFGTYHFLYSIAAAAIGSIITGLVLHHNRKRNDRLRASIERLKEHEFAEKELQIARDMQRRLLPPPLIERDGFRVTARTEAAHIVGGDFYDVLRLNDGRTAILAADVSGKGIAASLIMASCKAMVPFLASSGDTAEVMNALNQSLCDQLHRREFVAMLFVRFDAATGALEVVNAGMPDPLVISRSGMRALTFTGDRTPLGSMRASRYVATNEQLEAGERLMLFSDGLPEAMIGEVPLGYERVEELARKHPDVDALVDELHRTPGLRIDDDLTVVMLERSGR